MQTTAIQAYCYTPSYPFPNPSPNLRMLCILDPFYHQAISMRALPHLQSSASTAQQHLKSCVLHNNKLQVLYQAHPTTLLSPPNRQRAGLSSRKADHPFSSPALAHITAQGLKPACTDLISLLHSATESEQKYTNAIFYSLITVKPTSQIPDQQQERLKHSDII